MSQTLFKSFRNKIPLIRKEFFRLLSILSTKNIKKRRAPTFKELQKTVLLIFGLILFKFFTLVKLCLSFIQEVKKDKHALRTIL